MMLAGLVLCAGLAAAAQETDWAAINEASRLNALTVLRPGEPGKAPFWNAHARAFIHPPAFDFQEVAGAESYRFTVTELADGRKHTFDAEVPWAPLTPVWDAIRPGAVVVAAEGLDARGFIHGIAGSRYFHRAARFHGPYPSATGDYRAAAQRCFASIFRLPYVQGWLTQDTPPEGYDLYCYPSKIVSAMIDALIRFAGQASAGDAERALAVSRKMADWLIGQSQPSGTPLEHLPPTYWGDRRQTAVDYRGQNMMIYPVSAGLVYLRLAEKTGESRYREAAVRIAATMRKLQNEKGTWWLKVRERDGAPVRPNLLVPGLEFFEFFESVARITGDAGYSQVAARAARFVDEGTFRTWNWDGQFEDIDPKPPYVDLTPARAYGYSSWLFRSGRVADARLTLDWCEDQFVVWSDPVRSMDWRHWKMPTVLEQYDYYTPIDASMGNMIRALLVGWRTTGDALYLEKAKALGNCILRHQRPDGTIPTYFDERSGSDWINCMVVSAGSLVDLADTLTTGTKQ